MKKKRIWPQLLVMLLFVLVIVGFLPTQNIFNTNAQNVVTSPTFNCLANACPSTNSSSSASISAGISLPVSVIPSVLSSPSTAASSGSSSTQPCAVTTQSILHAPDQRRGGRGGHHDGGFLKLFFELFIKVLTLLLQQLGVSAPSGSSNPCPSTSPSVAPPVAPSVSTAPVNASPSAQPATATTTTGSTATTTPESSQAYGPIANQVLFEMDASNKPSISADLTNIKQGDAGDCYFLAALMAVANRSQETIKSLVHDNGNSTYTGRFYGLESSDFYGQTKGKGNFVATVTGDLPGGSTPANNWVENKNGKNVSWAAITEKLWAAVNGNKYNGIDGVGDSSTNDHDIQNGLFAITGIIPTGRPIQSLTVVQLQQDLSQGAVVIGTSLQSGTLTADHSLAVLSYNAATQTVTLGDPEGPRPQVPFQQFISSNANQYFFVPLPKN